MFPLRSLPALMLVLCVMHPQRAHAQQAATSDPPQDASDSAAQGAREITTRSGATGSVRLTLLSIQRDLTVYATRDRKYGVKLCSPDCVREIRPGTFAFGVSAGTREPKWEERVLEIDRDQTLLVSYESRLASRIMGSVLLPVSFATELFAWFFIRPLSQLGDSLSGEQSDGVDPTVVAFTLAGAVLAVSSIWLLTRRDKVRLETPAEHARRLPPVEKTATSLRIPGSSRLSQRVFACASPEDLRLEVNVEIDAAHGIASRGAPSAFGHGARRCLREALSGQTLPDAPVGQWKLVFSR